MISYTTGPNPDLVQSINQSVQYSQGANTFRVQKQINDWWLASFGSLASVYSGTSSFNENTTDGSGAATSGYAWQADGITLHRNSYIVSGSSLFLPAKGLSVSVSAQGEWIQEYGFGNVNLEYYSTIPPSFPAPGTENANQDRTISSENLDIRYNRLPRTVLFAEGRLRQESVGQSADQNTGGVSPYDFQQQTDSMNYFYDTRVGFTSSPRSWLEWGGHYRYRDSNTGYNNLVDTTPGLSRLHHPSGHHHGRNRRAARAAPRLLAECPADLSMGRNGFFLDHRAGSLRDFSRRTHFGWQHLGQ